MKFARIAALAAAVFALTCWVRAGGLDDPIVEPEVIVADLSTPSHDFLVPVVALILIATAVAGN